MRPGWLRASALAAAFLLVLAACGDSGNGDTSDTAASTDLTAGTIADSGLGGGGDDDSDLTLGTFDTVPNLIGVSSECEALVEVMLALGQIFAGVGGNAPELFAAAQDNLPDALDDDIAIMAEAAAAYAELLADAGIDLSDPTAIASLSPSEQQALIAASEVFNTPEVQEAFDNFGAYGEAECADEGF